MWISNFSLWQLNDTKHGNLFVYRVTLTHDSPYQYVSYGVACAETELDVLTGEYQSKRVDILFDCGQRYDNILASVPFYT